jgi:diphthine synthase
MLYLIGLGLNEQGISLEGIEAIRKCKEIYLENYSIEFPYSVSDLEKVIGKKVISLDRDKVESFSFLDKAKEEDVALLIYGDVLSATTHISILIECDERKIEKKIIHASSVFDAAADIGLQRYKFGKTISMSNQKAESFFQVIEENQKIGAHTLILVDIGMRAKDALEFLNKTCEKKKFKLERIAACSRLGNKNEKIYYGRVSELMAKNIETPVCLIVPGKMHFLEEDYLKQFLV